MSNGNAVERGDDGTDVDDLATLSKLDNQASLWLPSSHVHIIHLYTLKIGKKEKQHLTIKSYHWMRTCSVYLVV